MNRQIGAPSMRTQKEQWNDSTDIHDAGTTTIERPAPTSASPIWRPQSAQYRPILIASHERSGTHLTIDLIRRHFPSSRIRLGLLEHPHNSYFSLDKFFPGRKRSASIEDARAHLVRTDNVILKSHDLPNWRSMRDDARDFVRSIAEQSETIYCIRNPFKVFSSYWSWMWSWRGEQTGTFAEFLREPRDGYKTRVHYWAAHVRRWCQRSDVYVHRFEDTIDRTHVTIGSIGDFLDLEPRFVKPLLPRPVRGRVSKVIDKVFRGSQSTNLAGPKYVTPKPHEVFTPDDYELVLDATGDLMRRFGYDTSQRWMSENPRFEDSRPQHVAAA